MKTLFINEKGVALIALISAMVLLGLLGAGIVSFMASKQKSYPVQAQSYQALTLANAGAEFAIRYAKDRYESNDQDVSESLGSEITVNCGTDCGNRNFKIRYYSSLGGTNHVLQSKAQAGIAQREVRVAKFPGYVGGGGLIHTQVVDSDIYARTGCRDENGNRIPCPVDNAQKNIFIPLTNLFDSTVYIQRIEITIDQQGANSNNFVQELWRVRDGHNNQIYTYITDQNNSNYTGGGICIPRPSGGPSNNCKGRNPASVSPAIIPGNYSNHPLNLEIPPGEISELLNFKNSSVSDVPYKIKFWFDFDTNYNHPQSVEISFTPE